MNKSSIFSAAVIMAAMSSSAFSAATPVVTMTGGLANGTLSLSGCAAAKVSSALDIVFYSDNTYVVTQVNSTLLPNTGNYSLVTSSSGYTLYMEPSDQARDAMFTSMEALALTNCKLKKPATSDVTIIDPSVLTSKNSAVVKSKDKAITLTLQMKGKQQNNASGVSKLGNLSYKVTVKGYVTGVPPTM